MGKKTKKLNEGGYLARTARIDDPKTKNWSTKSGATDAIEPVYPLEELVLGKAVGKIAKVLGSKPEMAMRPDVTNSMYSKLPGGAAQGKKYAQRYVISPDEIQNIKDTGYMLPKAGGKAQKYLTAVDEVSPAPVGSRAGTLRVASNKVPPDKAIRRKDVELYDHKSESWKPLKKGGAVKAARGDGKAIRGKTRGRII